MIPCSPVENTLREESSFCGAKRPKMGLLRRGGFGVSHARCSEAAERKRGVVSMILAF